jgi:predicted nucleic acid-binding protein
MRVYLDNVAASGRVTGDLAPEQEMRALRKIEDAHRAGVVTIMTSRESWREQERTKDPLRRAKLAGSRGEVAVVTRDHVLLGFRNIDGFHGTTVVNPMVTDVVDESLFAELKTAGLEDADARHLMYAVTNSCERFVTLDPDFLKRRTVLQGLCPSIQVVTPSELETDLRTSQIEGAG